jgi:hypothetical protein
MSYLSPLRLHFAGTFQASVSTVNNDPLHYDNVTFKAQYQQLQSGNRPDQLNGWWNPRGDAAWRLLGCKVTSAWLSDGSAADKSDPIVSYLIADSDRQVTAKLVDIDPEQQLVSTIWGMEVRISTGDGTTLLRGRYQPASFMDIWDRAQSGGGDVGAGSMYQSLLTDLEWGDISASPFLVQLRDSAKDGRLSIKFNVDGYNMDYTSPDFTRGRIAGTIGPASADEPAHLVLGRQFMTTGLPSGNFFAPAGGINYCVAQVDPVAGKIFLDLGNALPTDQPGGPMSNLGTIALVCTVPPTLPKQPSRQLALGSIEATVYTDPAWYATTAGVVALPPDRKLSSDELSALAENPLSILLTGSDGTATTAISEPPMGLYVRADQFVFRIDPGHEISATLYATQYGQPYANADVIAIYDPSQLQPGSPLGTAPVVGTPSSAIEFPARVTTDAKGIATLTIKAGDPGNPRGYIDGQVYGVRPVLEETIFLPGSSYPFNQWNFITLLVWDQFKPDQPPTWYGSLQPIFQQYANLYPVMDRFLNLADYDSVCANSDLLLLAFGLDRNDPNAMPVTRDLSDSKRLAILQWLSQPGPDGKPLKGTPPAADQPVLAAAPESAPTADAASARRGGKAAAADRRLGLLRVRR